MISPEEKIYRPESIVLKWTDIRGGYIRKVGIQLSEDPDRVCFYVVFKAPLPELSENLGLHFVPYTTKGGDQVYYCGSGYFDLESACTINARVDHLVLPLNVSDTSLQESLNIPTMVTCEEVAELFKSNKILVYTGAGISVAAGTPDLNMLEQMLGIQIDTYLDSFLTTTVLQPDNMKEKIMGLQASFFEGSTAAHRALAGLQAMYGFDIVTENLDCLHEGAGTIPLKRGDINATFTDDKLSNIDYIVTVGLRLADSRLIASYCASNPNGRIVALNISPPAYLREGDLYLEGDVQKTLPSILKFCLDSNLEL